jgi:5S rRNA maturation endonuclease (ribonuclease M5)
MLTTIQDAVKLLLPSKRKTNSTSGWISFNAPCCHHNGESADTRGRGGLVFNPDGGTSYHCFNCNFKASYQPGRHLTYKFRKLLSWLGASENEVKRLVIDAIRVKELVAPETLVEVEEAEPINFKARPLPEEAQTFVGWETYYTLSAENPRVYNVPADYHNSVMYAAERNIDFIKYDLMWTPETSYNLHKRVIIPFTWKNEVIGYTSRTFDDNVKPKYHSSYEPNYVFNTDKQLKDAKFVIVVEGPFDAMAVDGVAVLSNECSEIQADIIDSLGREVIVVPDADKAGAKLVDQAVEYGWSVSFPVWQETHKDVASAVEEYGKLFVIKSIIEAKQSNRLKIELRKKKIYN